MKFHSLFRALAALFVLALLASPSALAAAMPYAIDVDLSNNIVTVYSTADGSIVRRMVCSAGTYNYPSPTGVYYMPEKYKEMERTEWYVFEDGYGKYGSRIWDNYLFHSYLFDEPDEETLKWDSYAAMGTPASHGCIRLYIEDAKWVAENCMPGTKVNLFHTDKRYTYEKEILYGGTYTRDSGMTYAQYVCMAENEGEMGYSSRGEDVAAFQRQLIDLGLYGGEADGFYGPQMVRTVKALQALLGRAVTGVADEALAEIIRRGEGPVSSIRTLSEGMAGEPVSTLQAALSALGLYTGEASGTYDTPTREAVAAFQRMKGLIPDGVAAPAVQQAILSEIDALSRRYGEGGYRLVQEAQLRTIGTVNSRIRLNLRAEDGTVIGGVEPGTRVEVLDTGDERTRIACPDGKEGYVSAPYLLISEESIMVPKYEAAESPDEALPALRLSGFARTRTVFHGTVNIGSKLRIRSAPDVESDLLFLINPGDTCEILSFTDSGWAQIRYGRKTGYAMAEYFDVESTVEITGSYACEP